MKCTRHSGALQNSPGKSASTDVVETFKLAMGVVR